MTTTAPIDRPLSSVRVVDLVEGPLTIASRYLAELGAHVDRIAQQPLASDPLADRVANIGKTIHAIDASSAAAQALLAAADIIITDQPIDADGLLRQHPSKVILEMSPFGRGNSLSGWQGSDAVFHALSGELSRSGIAGREPLLPPGALAWQCAAVQAAYVALQSFFLALRTGRGDHIDFAALDGAIQALDPGFGIGGSATLGRPAHLLSRDRPPRGFQYPILPCADGHVRICVLSARQWQSMFRWMGEPQAFADPSFNSTAVRYKSPELLQAFAAFFAGQTRAELEAGAVAHGVPLSALASLHEVTGIPHFQQRQAFRQETVDGRSHHLTNGCVVIDGTRMTPDAPGAGAATPLPSPASLPISRPFEGLKVLDLGVIVVGAEAARMLADQGADVIKVESRSFPDGNRQSYLPYGLSASFAAGQRNKRSLGLDLRDPRGRQIFLQLVREADVLLTNFKPGTLESLGFGPDVLAAENPGIVSVESSAFGDSGPWSRRMGYGPLVRAAIGITDLWRYADDAGSFSDSITIYPDHVAGRMSAIAAIALLIRRLRTGRGGRATIAQSEVALTQFAEDIARMEAGLPVRREDSTVYPCAGDDEWCVVTCRSEEDTAAIVRATGGQPLVDWMKGRQAAEAMESLQGQGVPAARMLRVAELPDLASQRERDQFRTERHPYLAETLTAEVRQALARELGASLERPAPLAGEHSAEVLEEWLGLDAETLSALIRDGVVQPASAEELAVISAHLAQ